MKKIPVKNGYGLMASRNRHVVNHMPVPAIVSASNGEYAPLLCITSFASFVWLLKDQGVAIGKYFLGIRPLPRTAKESIPVTYC